MLAVCYVLCSIVGALDVKVIADGADAWRVRGVIFAFVVVFLPWLVACFLISCLVVYVVLIKDVLVTRIDLF